MIGGPIGAVIGVVIGSSFDSGMKKTRLGDDDLIESLDDHERTQMAFFGATFSVMGHVAKLDGHVSRHEIEFVEKVMDQLILDGEQRKFAVMLFRQGKEPGFDLESTVAQLYTECHRRKDLLRLFLVMQIKAALADGRVSSEENATLWRISDQLRFDRREFESLFKAETGVEASPSSATIKSDYEILQIKSDASDKEVSNAYRRLMSQYHPDKLVAKGLPDELINVATEKTKQVRAAYERIREARKSQTVH